MTKPKPPVARLAVLLFALAFPTIYTWAYFIALDDAPAVAQQAVSAGGKLIQFTLPVVWVFWWRKQRPHWQWPTGGDFLWGIGSGLLILAAMFALYWGWLKTAPAFVEAVGPIREKVHGFGIDTAWKFAALGIFYSLIHSLGEEYYWRWFTFGKLLLPEKPVEPVIAISHRSSAAFAGAVLISSLGFMAHHVLVLAKYFGIASPLTWIFSFGVAAGGVIWALLYARTGRLYAPWLSHLLVDVAIFVIGYDVVQNSL